MYPFNLVMCEMCIMNLSAKNALEIFLLGHSTG